MCGLFVLWTKWHKGSLCPLLSLQVVLFRASQRVKLPAGDLICLSISLMFLRYKGDSPLTNFICSAVILMILSLGHAQVSYNDTKKKYPVIGQISHACLGLPNCNIASHTFVAFELSHSTITACSLVFASDPFWIRGNSVFAVSWNLISSGRPSYCHSSLITSSRLVMSGYHRTSRLRGLCSFGKCVCSWRFFRNGASWRRVFLVLWFCTKGVS